MFSRTNKKNIFLRSVIEFKKAKLNFLGDNLRSLQRDIDTAKRIKKAIENALDSGKDLATSGDLHAADFFMNAQNEINGLTEFFQQSSATAEFVKEKYMQEHADLQKLLAALKSHSGEEELETESELEQEAGSGDSDNEPYEYTSPELAKVASPSSGYITYGGMKIKIPGFKGGKSDNN